MNSIYDLSSNRNKETIVSCVRAIVLTILLISVVIGIPVCWFLYQISHAFEPVINDNKLNSKESWAEFIWEFGSDTAKIRNVKSYSDFNMLNGVTSINFETDSNTLFNLLFTKCYKPDSSEAGKYIDSINSKIIWVDKINSSRYKASFSWER